jgi:predicted nuclease of predicted toxin-antitoxin system
VQLAILLRQRGHNVLHTLDLPDGNRTSDERICDRSESDDRVVISKDGDFVALPVGVIPRR